MTAINDRSDRYVDQLTAHSPLAATFLGYPGHDHALDDLSPDGLEAGREIAVGTLADLERLHPESASDEIAREVITERLTVEVDRFDAGWAHADLNVIASPLQDVRQVFDLMPTDTDDQWETIARRLAAVPAALAGYRASLQYAARRGRVPAARQVDKCAEQCAVHAGLAGEPSAFASLVEGAGQDGALGTMLEEGARAAAAAFGTFGEFLRTELRPVAPAKDAVGRERYALASRDFLGATVDLDEAYAWGWQEFLSIEAELRQVAERIAPGAGPAGAAAALDASPTYRITGVEAFRQWMQDLSDRAVEGLGATHFEIVGPMAQLECRIAPPGGVVGAYYTQPSEDFSRPGAMWWSLEPGRDEFPTWRETTTVYHEGVPGHHLQLAAQVFQRDRLNAFQRLVAGTSGHCEGWALYAERLVRELGYLDDDGTLLGMLDAQLFRAARVVVDIGMHLELAIPGGTGFHEGERWTPELGLEFMLTRTLQDPAAVRDELDRYLGWPGQAPAYKLGERVWLAGRDAARRRHGPAFDLKAFHTAALAMGGMGLDPLARRLAAL